MSKKILIIIIFLTSNIVNSQNDSILWKKDHKLKWDDFKGSRDFGKINTVAVTQCAIKIADIRLINEIPNIKIETYFIKSDSWTITNELHTLEHEQTHFDIYELYSRKIRKGFDKLKNQKIKDIKIYQNLFIKLIKEAEIRNQKFDKEVYFNLEKQNAWIVDITKELENLSKYE